MSEVFASYQSMQARLLALKVTVQEANSVQTPILPSISSDACLWSLVLAEAAHRESTDLCLSPRFVCKERSFRLNFSLRQLGDVELDREQELTAEAKVWNGNMTKLIETSLANLPIVAVKAAKTRYLSSKKAHNLSLKIKLNEVSSHFETGEFTLQIDARIAGILEYEGRVQPCFIRNVVVRAKAVTCLKDLKREGKKSRVL
jgi:hypothetical protein